MVAFTLPKNSRIGAGRDLQGAGRRQARARTFKIYRWNPDDGREPAHRHLRDRSRRVRADGSGRADQDQERDRPDADLPPLLPRGHLRLLRDEHRRRQHPGLPQADRGRDGRGQDLPAAAHGGGQGSGARPHRSLRPVRSDRALAAGRHAAAAGRRAAAEQGGARQARRPVGVHPVLLLHHLLPQLLVERRPLSRPGRAAAGLSLDRRQPRRGTRASGWTSWRIRSSSTAATPS